MKRDIRDTTAYRDAQALLTQLRQPGTGQISDAAELDVAADGGSAIFVGSLLDKLDGAAPGRLCLTDMTTGDTRVVTLGPHSDRHPRYSPDGGSVAFLSDRHRAGDFQLYLLNPSNGAVRPTAPVQGWVEYLHWSPDGRRILLGVAGYGADVAGAQGAVASQQRTDALPPWMPTVETGEESHRWRRVWVYEVATNRVLQIEHANNVWEAAWCGNEALAAVVSPGPGEGDWYRAHLALIDLKTGRSRTVLMPEDQLGLPAGAPSGEQLAVVEAICSDRWMVAGELRLIDTATGQVRSVDTHGVDISCCEWRSDESLLLAGHRGFETVVALFHVHSNTFTEVWRSDEIGTAGRFAAVAGFGMTGDCALIGEGFTRAPEIAVIRQGDYRTVRSFDLGYSDRARAIAGVERLSWNASDGLEIQGWLLRPGGEGPYPLILAVHGGPVWHWRPHWLGRSNAAVLMLLERGYAVYLPNPRGSTSRGRMFARAVLGDMGGADTYDCLCGLDELVARGIADPERLGVTGGSYGGFMSSWLICQDLRFGAAVPVVPVNNWVTEHLISNIPAWPALFLADDYRNPNGLYFQRSPVMHAHKVKTPTLHICGGLDRSAPAEEALQFHNALRKNAVESVLVTYPEEGHGVRQFPAMSDYVARVVGWFESHL